MNLFHCTAHWKAGRQRSAPDLRDAFLCVKCGILPLLQLVCIFRGVMDWPLRSLPRRTHGCPAFAFRSPPKPRSCQWFHASTPQIQQLWSAQLTYKEHAVVLGSLTENCAYRNRYDLEGLVVGLRSPQKWAGVPKQRDCSAVCILRWTSRQKNTQLYLFSLHAEMYSCT